MDKWQTLHNALFSELEKTTPEEWEAFRKECREREAEQQAAFRAEQQDLFPEHKHQLPPKKFEYFEDMPPEIFKHEHFDAIRQIMALGPALAKQLCVAVTGSQYEAVLLFCAALVQVWVDTGDDVQTIWEERPLCLPWKLEDGRSSACLASDDDLIQWGKKFFEHPEILDPKDFPCNYE